MSRIPMNPIVEMDGDENDPHPLEDDQGQLISPFVALDTVTLTWACPTATQPTTG
jgi:hypothetical protein